MKKKIFKLLTGMLLSCALAGSTVAVQAEEAGTDTVKSYLTGEDVSVGIGHRRPIAVMLGNDTNGAPQSGTENAGVIYEAPVEGSITRLMAIIEDYDNIPRIGSVRSCRDYFLFYANEYDAIYSHYGQAVYALQYLDQHLIDNLNGLTLGNAYYRSTDRVAPHNAYTDFSHLQAGIQSQGYSQDYKEDYNGHFQFAPEGTETTLDDGVSANVVKLDNFAYNHPWFEYNEGDGKYYRFQYGGKHNGDGGQIAVRNVIFQYVEWGHYASTDYLNINVHKGGAGYVFTGGKCVPVSWKKDGDFGPTRYYDSEGKEVMLNKGKTWICIVGADRFDKAEIYGK